MRVGVACLRPAHPVADPQEQDPGLSGSAWAGAGAEGLRALTP